MAWKSGQSYSSDLRSRVLAAVDGGSPARAVGQLFQVSVSYVYKALARRETTGETEARPQRNQQTLKLKDLRAAIATEVASRPDVTLEELRAWLLANHQVTASLGLMHKTLARLGLTLKKSRGGPKSRTGPTSPGSGRQAGSGLAAGTAKRRLKREMNRASTRLAASRSVAPASRSSTTSRSWKVPQARSMRPLACGLRAAMETIPSSPRARTSSRSRRSSSRASPSRSSGAPFPTTSRGPRASAT